ncbi:hypothetical protein L1987_38976 [Smallanthus sonchifolius]|uniref:Uncharacterized protein n=1 Tax=Smallanthus sonchifolius TaxID=185202 RepID=A0ACB9HKR7_9ASTR|nr:hypothetical protein L1987_38976 [Smallanthus sonchifolius]
MTTTLQLKLRGVFLADDSPDNLTNPIGNIFSMLISVLSNFFQYLMDWINQEFQDLTNPVVKIFPKVVSTVSNFFQCLIGWFNQEFQNLKTPVVKIFSKAVFAVNNFFQYLIDLFNEEFPPETRDEQIRRLIIVATPYLIVAVVLVTCLYFGSFSWSILVGCFEAVKCLFSFIRNILNRCFNAVKCLLSCIRDILVKCFEAMCSFFNYIFPCLQRGTEVGIKMMKAPGKPLELIARAAFEANPAGYFRSLRVPNI